MKTLIVALMGVMLLGACASDSVYHTPSHNIYEEVNRLNGKPINDAKLVLGNPTGTYAKGGTVAYLWQHRASSSIFGNAFTDGRGYQVGGRIDGMNPMMLQGVPYYRCTVKANTADGIITKIWLEENTGGCRYVYDKSDDDRLGFESRR